MDSKRKRTADFSAGHTAKYLLAAGLFLAGLLLSSGRVFAGDSRVPNEPPTILSHTPDINDTQVPVNGVISVVWDRPMQPDTNFTVTGPEGFIQGVFLYDNASYTVTFMPNEDFAPDIRYGVLVAGQTDANGAVQQTPYQWNFTTVGPTAVSIISFGSTDETPEQGWLWSSWPVLMAAVSIFSLIGFIVVWNYRRLIESESLNR